MSSNLKVLLSAYACRPGEGSEPGVGWQVARELAKHHKIWVITRENNRPYIEVELNKNSIPGLNFIYCDTPKWLVKLNLKQQIVYLHYYVWQIQAYFSARQLHQKVGFDLVHHVTYVRYSSPSFLSLLPIPFIWGPVGGGESAPKTFWPDFSLRGKVYEIFRNLARRLGELDPFVRLTARRSVFARATTEDTAERLRKLGAENIQVVSQLGLSEQEIAQLAKYGQSEPNAVRFISVGRLLHWKGFNLGLRAFAQADLPDNAEYWIVGDGPERSRLESLAEELGIDHRVKFWNKLSRKETLQKLAECLALIHPSLHESGGLVCLEAMAAGRPVICLNLGGPSILVTEETGFKVSVHNPEQVVNELALTMIRLVKERNTWMSIGQSAQQRIKDLYNWESKCQSLAKLYQEIIIK
ncbi:MAG: glycosyltransferase [Xenococcus sp. MO_188.B8]|nr:glycosyltransferase [Xenococcus sp. MO_188.B8]